MIVLDEILKKLSSLPVNRMEYMSVLLESYSIICQQITRNINKQGTTHSNNNILINGFGFPKFQHIKKLLRLLIIKGVIKISDVPNDILACYRLQRGNKGSIQSIILQ